MNYTEMHGQQNIKMSY